ncbi:dihydrodipicolinate synthase family protein [Roseobacter sp. YSTF-M11]|uniref:Dihydrodipicolinate synthase family protein n=1 Tax=Roseobacter insulae TaxID=2859783 RepID=A0A9X1FTK6_9RHOB|nr:dihydrodipicolinate synthase family protein [Roseobacter insulae]MBW4707407.1 dihydrodipicolinate synthase family protein [Roseobacter insulae]
MSFGISAALLTPFCADGSIDRAMLRAHATGLLDDGLTRVTLFGTTGEGASIGFTERSEAIATVVDSGVAPTGITLGLCACAIPDVLAQVGQGLSSGITDFLLPPPFYFKGLDDAGVFAWNAQLFRDADARAKFILYNIPQVTSVPLSVHLVHRLRRAFPERVMAIKDSSGDWANTQALLKHRDIPVLVGDERLLHKAAALGAAGSICGMANLYPRRLLQVFETHKEDADLCAEVDRIVSVPVIPALKLIIARITGHADWENTRPPLQALSGQARAAIMAGMSGKVTA